MGNSTLWSASILIGKALYKNQLPVIITVRPRFNRHQLSEYLYLSISVWPKIFLKM